MLLTRKIFECSPKRNIRFVVSILKKKKKQIVKTNLDENGKIQQYNYDDNIFYTTGTIRLSYYSIFVDYVH